MEGHSKACHSLPPVTSNDYEPKGKYEKIAGLNTYITGNVFSTKCIIEVHDIFGLSGTPTLQGGDRLAASLDVLVLIPDFFNGEPVNGAWFPQDTEEKKRNVQQWMAEKKLYDGDYVSQVNKVAEDVKTKYRSVASFGLAGFCWGGKIAALASREGTLFKVSAQAHPAKLTKEDAEAITIPHVCLASKDEPLEAVKEYEEVFRSGNKTGLVETYSKMHHGWMGARANLKDEENLKGFEQGFNQLAEFFAKYL